VTPQLQALPISWFQAGRPGPRKKEHDMTKTWFITGTSRGFGRVWAEAALQRGDKVVATARDAAGLRDLVETYGDRVLPLDLDIDDRSAVFSAVHRGATHFGGIDVFVNNAGFGSMGAVEEISEQQARQQFETNVFGALWGIQAIAPVMREQGSGHIVAVSSQLGLVSVPTAALYAASKWALEGLVQGFAAEMAPFGVHVTLVEPAGYKTGFYDPDALVVAPRMTSYAEVHAGMDQLMSTVEWGVPEATADAMLSLVDAEEPPLRLILGRGPLEWVRSDYAGRLAELDAWRDVSEAAFGA
jgi:NAD(P)-dependent dehydrogenase (short-subunit alcohol dehydrogenase family)